MPLLFVAPVRESASYQQCLIPRIYVSSEDVCKSCSLHDAPLICFWAEFLHVLSSTSAIFAFLLTPQHVGVQADTVQYTTRGEPATWKGHSKNKCSRIQ